MREMSHESSSSHFFPQGLPSRKSKIGLPPLRAQPPERDAWYWGNSKAFSEILESIRLAAQKNLTVLIVGETGTGKELIARKIYRGRLQAQSLSLTEAPFVAVNAGALPESLAESLLFGHERGAFTSARERQHGKFEMAQKGCLFLDEIQCLNPNIQVKLLRVLQTKQFERLGAKAPLPIECQMVAASNVPLEILVEKKSFRKDLYFRLNICPIYLPALRQRKEDLPQITQGLLDRVRKDYKTRATNLSAGALELILQHDWPGNLRELEHALLYASLRSDELIEADQLPRSLTGELSHFVQKGSWNF